MSSCIESLIWRGDEQIKFCMALFPIDTNQNLAEHMQVVTQLESLGFRYDPAQVAAAERKSGAFKGVAEYVFRR